MRLRKSLAVAAAGALALTLAACGGSGGSSGGSGSGGAKYQSQGTNGSATDATAKGPAQPVPNAVSGGTVTVLLPSPDTGPTTLDPTAGWSVTGNSIQQDLVNRSLTTYRYDPTSKQMVLVPDLATDLGQHSADFKTWTFTLKSGLKYDNGKPVTAQDVAWGIERSFDGNNGTTGGGIAGPGTQYSAQYFLDGTKYNGPYDKTTKGKKYDGVSVSGNKITIKMATPFPDMDYYGSFMAMGPIPTGAVSNPPKYGNKPWATGPYKVQSFQAGKELVLVKNTQWDPNTDPARHQYVDKWIFKFDQDANTTDQLMLSKNAQSSTTLTTSVLSTNYAKMKSNLGSANDQGLQQGSTQCTSFLYPDYTKITNIKVRQAIAYAYPYEDAWSAAGEVVGVTRVAGTSIEPPGMVGRKSFGAIDGQTPTYDPAKAKELLKEAGVKPNTFTLSWVYKSGDPQALAGMQQVAKGYQAAGFKTKTYPYSGSPYDVWTAPKGTTTASRLRAKTNIEGVAWCADWPSALTFIPPLFQTGQTYNTGHFSEADVDAKIKSIPSMPASQQAAAWADLDKEIMTKYYPVVNTGYINNLMAVGSKIGGFHNDGEIGAPDYRDIYVEK